MDDESVKFCLQLCFHIEVTINRLNDFHLNLTIITKEYYEKSTILIPINLCILFIYLDTILILSK